MPTSSPPSNGDVVAVGANQPLLLKDGDVWLVRKGGVDVFAVPVAGGVPSGRRRHLVRMDPDTAVFGASPAAPPVGLGLVAVGIAGTELARVAPDTLADPQHAADALHLAETWTTRVSQGLVRQAAPHDETPLQPGTPATLPAGTSAGAGAPLVWVKLTEGQVTFLGDAEVSLPPGDAWWPLTPLTWITATTDAKLECIDTATARDRGVLWPALPRFLALVLECLAVEARRTEAEERERLARELETEQRVVESAVEGLASVVPGTDGIVSDAQLTGDRLLDACKVVAAAAGIEIDPARGPAAAVDPKDRLEAIARTSSFRTRPVTLEGDWWRQDNGPLLAFRTQDGAPVALLPESPKRYVLVDPATHTRTAVDASAAGTLRNDAVMFYRPLPGRALSIGDLFRFSRRGLGRDAVAVVGLGMLGGLVGMLTPIATGMIFDTLIPSADRTRLLQMTMALIVAALAAGVFDVVRSIAIMRVSGRVDATLQAATWDRLLTLPVPFFRDYSAGDLATRASAVNAIQQTLTGAVLSSLLAAVFSLFNLGLMFWYEIRLTFIALALVLIVLIVMAVANYLQLRRQRVLLKMEGALAGLVLQLINGVNKLRVAGGEPRAFAVWAARFAAQRRIEFRSRRVAYSVAVFNSAFSVIAVLIIFFSIWYWPNDTFDTGTFLSFNAAFGQFMAAVLGMTGAITSSISVVPLYERARPILATLPEVDRAKVDPGPLKGAIEVNRVSFRYRPDGPIVLHELSISVKAGEFVALVGPSGAGKSTLYRMLLGFETPPLGTIFYDGQDLAGLDVRAVRRQIGVVLQNGKLLWGSIYQNIVGAAPLTMEDAWEAARAAGLEDDINAMPMGMQTFIGEGATTFSGGQRQRLMIARAVVNKPRIILFDEATSALDNETQAIVSNSLTRLKATRLVIAHRLSTIVKADRIYVIETGRIVENGTYQELMAANGAFAALARRQIT
jgi:NHLM bacteriocin system ABC transporter ATP-binding protein